MGRYPGALGVWIVRRAKYLVPIGAACLVTLPLVRPSGRWEGGVGPWTVPVRHASAPSLPHDPAEILATGRSSRWHFRYPGRDRAFGTSDDLSSVGDLCLPLGAAVRCVLASDDSIYTFSVPEMGIRGMAVPDVPSSFSIRADRPGTFELAADPMCGQRPNHVGRLLVVTRPEFAAWLDGLSRAAGTRRPPRTPLPGGAPDAGSRVERP
ncbi:MAG: hypothetical protein WKF75_19815 [Singulisphaera sp.]